MPHATKRAIRGRYATKPLPQPRYYHVSAIAFLENPPMPGLPGIPRVERPGVTFSYEHGRRAKNKAGELVTMGAYENT